MAMSMQPLLDDATTHQHEQLMKMDSSNPPICLMEYTTSISIPKYSKTTPISFHIALAGPVRSWTVNKRYSDLLSLHERLNMLFPNKGYEFPPKTFSPWTNEAFLEKRRDALEKWLIQILDSKDSAWRRSQVWKDFFQVPDIAESDLKITSRSWLDEYDGIKTQLMQSKAMMSGAKSRADVIDAQFKAKRTIKALASAMESLENWVKDQEAGNGEISRG
jgi:hypothetical protein